MKKKLSREFKIGAFGIAMLLLLYFSINFIKSNRIFTSDKTFYAVFESADGLEASAPVMTKGFRIGTVETVEFDLNTQQIIVKMSVLKEYPLPMDSKVKITSSSLLGGKIIEVLFGQNRAQKIPNKDTIPAVFEPSLIQMAGAEYSSIKDKLSSFSGKLDNALSGLESALSPETVGNLKNTIANLNKLTSDLSSVVDNRRSNIENIIRNLDSLSNSLRKMAPKIDKTITNLSAASDSLPNLMANAAKSIEKLTRVITKVEQGEGNLGKLVNDEELYKNITESMNSLNLLIQDLKTNPKKYINVVVFPKKEKQPKQ